MTSKMRKFEIAKATAASSSTDASSEWQKGDWLPYTVTEQSLNGYIAGELLPVFGWRIPEAEREPTPRNHERVLLSQFIN